MFTADTPTCAVRSMRPNRRRRVAARAWRRPCRVSIVGAESRRASLPAETTSASRDALAVLVSSPIPPGTPIETVIPVPGGEFLRVRGTVEHLRPAPAGAYEVEVRLSGVEGRGRGERSDDRR